MENNKSYWPIAFMIVGVAFALAWTLRGCAEHSSDCIKACHENSICLC